LADAEGLVFSKLDCLFHLNLTKLKELVTDLVPNTCGGACSVIELINFEKYGMLSTEGNGGAQDKDAKDLAEMRIV